jgi:hypothetical protein
MEWDVSESIPTSADIMGFVEREGGYPVHDGVV